MTHDCNTRVNKHDGNVSTDDDPLNKAKLEENNINHINISVPSQKNKPFLNRVKPRICNF